MANVKRPLSPSVPGEFTVKGGYHFPAPRTSTSVAQVVPPTFASQQQTVVGYETVTLTFTIAAMAAGESATIKADALAYFQSQGAVKLAPTDSGQIIVLPSPAPQIDNAMLSGPNVTLSARGGTIGANGSLSPGTSYSQIAANGSIKVYATGPVPAQKVTVAVTAQLSGASLS